MQGGEEEGQQSQNGEREGGKWFPLLCQEQDGSDDPQQSQDREMDGIRRQAGGAEEVRGKATPSARSRL